MSGTVWAAIITGSLGLLASVVSLVFNARNQRKQAEFENQLKRREAEEDAWRAYEFQALKRLYGEVRPLLFQVAEQSHLGRDRLGRVLKGEINALEKVGTTTLRICAPLVLARDLQRRLTNVDLALDDSVRNQYFVVREMLNNLHAGRAIAAVEPKIDYRRAGDPRAHLTWSQLDRVIEVFTVREADGSTRPMRQGELDAMLVPERVAELDEKLKVVRALFGNLPEYPSRVLGRLLLAQAAFMHALIQMQDSAKNGIPISVLPIKASDVDWPFIGPADVAAAEAYVRGRLPGVSFQSERADL